MRNKKQEFKHYNDLAIQAARSVLFAVNDANGAIYAYNPSKRYDAAKDADETAHAARHFWEMAADVAQAAHNEGKKYAAEILAASCAVVKIVDAAALANATAEKPAPPVVDEYAAARRRGRVLNEKMRRQVARDDARAEKFINAQAARLA